MTLYTGGCFCGAVRYEIKAKPVRNFQCQCRDCQKDTGGGHSSVAVFARAAMKITGEAVEHQRIADSGAEKRKGFCGNCGSPLYNRPENVPDLIGVYVGTLDDPAGFEPQMAMYVAQGHDWDHLDPALPKVPYMRPPS